MDWFIANIEIFTTALIGMNVFLCARNNIWNWPIGLAAVTMYGMSAWFLWGLYADAALQVAYFISGVVGWIYWAKGGKGRTAAPITDLKEIDWALISVLIFAGTFFLGNYLDKNTDSVVPYLDAYTTVVCLIAQTLLILRKRAAWILWIAANVAYVYMFHIKGLNYLAVEYGIFILNAMYGYYTWTKVKKSQCSTPTSSAA